MIKRLSSLIGIDLKYYLSGGSFLFAGNWVSMVLKVLTVWFFTNYTTKDTYGAYSYIQAILVMLVVFTLPGYYTAVVRSVARGYHGALLASVRVRMAFSLIGSLLLVGAAVFFWKEGKADIAKGCLIGSAFFGMVHGLSDFSAFFAGTKRHGHYAGYNFAVSLAATIGTVAMILLGQDFLIILFVNLGIRGIAQGICTVLAAGFRENKNLEEDFYQFGNRQSAISAFGSLSYYLDGVLVGTFFPLATMATYNFSMLLTEPFRNVGVILNRLILPKMVNLKGRALAKKTFAKAFWLMAALAGLGLVFFLALPYLLHWFFPKYVDARPYAVLMMVSALFGVLVSYLETFFLSQERFHKLFYTVTIVRPVSIILLLPPLMYLFGVWGAIGAKLIARVVESLFLLVYLYFGWGYDSDGSIE